MLRAILLVVCMCCTAQFVLHGEDTFEYTSMSQKTFQMQAWEGTHVALLVPANWPIELDKRVMRRLLAGIDMGYAYYLKATGRAPNAHVNFHGKLSIAVVEGMSEAACGYLGFQGIEIGPGIFEEMYQEIENRNGFEQTVFYELGRNFFFYLEQLTGRAEYPGIGQSSFNTGFAVYMRFKALDFLVENGFRAADYGGQPYAAWKDEMLHMIDEYEADPSLTFEGTFASNRAPYREAGGTDLFSSMLYRLDELFEGDFAMRFWKEVAKRPTAYTDQQAIDNVFISASNTTQHNLQLLFVDKWRWHISDRAKQAVERLPLFVP